MIDWPAVLAAFTAGLLGSVHCAAMCGGIATALMSSAPRNGLRAAIEINAGRLGGYMLAGALVGLAGSALIGVLRLPWLGTTLRVLVGAMLVLIALRLLAPRARFALLARPGAMLWQAVRRLQPLFLPADRSSKRLALGMIWGWMPCGLSTMMLAAAWLQADPIAATATMAAFGLGTLVTMLPLTWTGARLVRRLQGPLLRPMLATTILAAGLLTATAPLLAQVPALHRVLTALGCVTPT